jgi:hypothetical protein
LKEPCQEGLCCLLQSQHGVSLEAHATKAFLKEYSVSNLTHKARKRHLAHEQVGGLLVLADLLQCPCAWPVPMGLLSSFSNLCGYLNGGLGLGSAIFGGAALDARPGGCKTAAVDQQQQQQISSTPSPGPNASLLVGIKGLSVNVRISKRYCPQRRSKIGSEAHMQY